MKTARKVFLYLLLALAVLLIAFMTSVFLFKDKIISQFIREANKQLSTPVKIGHIDVSVFEKFPDLSIVLTDVYVEDSHPGQYPLLTAKALSFQLNPIEVWSGVYTIRGLHIRDSETNLKINASGVNNYTVVKGKGKADRAISFALENVNLQNTKVHYSDQTAEQVFDFNSAQLLASIQTTNDIYNIEAEGELTTERISVEGNSFLNEKSFSIKSELVYDDIKKLLTIKPSSLELKGSSFLVKGEYRWKDKNLIDLVTEGKDTDIHTLLSLLSESVVKNLEKYQSKGDVYFKAKLKGEISSHKSPFISIDFGFKDATLFHPDYKSKIEEAELEGSFASSAVADPRQAVLAPR